MQLYKLEQKSH